MSERVIPTMSQDGRIVICGQISMYDTAEAYPPPVSDIAQAYMERKAISRDRYGLFPFFSSPLFCGGGIRLGPALKG